MFNASIEVTELLMKTLENVARGLASKCIMESGKRHGFDVEEEIRLLGLEKVCLTRKPMGKKGSKEKKVEKLVLKENKSLYPMPFVPERVDMVGCGGLSYNRGLFTQCTKKRMENGKFCNGCQSEADKNASGCPDCGTIESRLQSKLYEFKDPKGRSPTSYIKVLEKMKLPIEKASEEAGKLSIVIPNEHLISIEAPKKTKGRPKSVKKSDAVEANDVSDLFAKLTVENNDDTAVSSDDGEDVPIKKAKLSDEEKAAKKALLEEERAIKKAEREAKLNQEKEEREAKRKAEIDIKKAEREAKVTQEKEEREAKREAEKLEREAKREAEKLEREAKREAEKLLKKTVKAAPKDAPKTEEKVAPKDAPKTEEKVAPKDAPKTEEKVAPKDATKTEEKVATKDAPKTEEKVATKDATKTEEKVAAKTEEKVATKDAPKTEEKVATKDAPKSNKAVKMQICGKAYLRTSDNIMYDAVTKDEVGIWDPESKTIKPLPDDDEEELEEDYDDDDN
jgi:hypothetical protein